METRTEGSILGRSLFDAQEQVAALKDDRTELGFLVEWLLEYLDSTRLVHALEMLTGGSLPLGALRALDSDAGSRQTPFRNIWRSAKETNTESAWKSVPSKVAAMQRAPSAADLQYLSMLADEYGNDPRRGTAVAEAIAEIARRASVGARDDLVQSLQVLISSSSPQVRIAAIEALWQIDAPEAERLIRLAADDDHDWVRRTALEALRG